MMRRRLIRLAAGLSALGVVLAAGATGVGAERESSDSAGIRAAQAFTEGYRVEAHALADGYTRTEDCVPAMGYHYIHPGRLDTRLEPSRPEALLYRTTTEGDRQLVGAEWIVVDGDQDLATDDDRPSLFGHPFDGPMPGHAPGMPIHYDLHAYVWVENPNGAFSTWNPAITCP